MVGKVEGVHDMDEKGWDDMIKDVSITIRKCTSEALMLGGSLTLASKLPSVDAEFETILAGVFAADEGWRVVRIVPNELVGWYLFVSEADIHW